MTGAELKQLRHDLGDAIGRRLSVTDMAKICGLAPANGADTWRKWRMALGPAVPWLRSSRCCNLQVCRMRFLEIC
jgi:hypothetical protein